MVGLNRRLSVLEESSRRRALEGWKALIRAASIEDLAELLLEALPEEGGRTLSREKEKQLWQSHVGLSPEVVHAAEGFNPTEEWLGQLGYEVSLVMEERMGALLKRMRQLDPKRTQAFLKDN